MEYMDELNGAIFAYEKAQEVALSYLGQNYPLVENCNNNIREVENKLYQR